MRRRSLLSGIGVVAVAGCLSGDRESGAEATGTPTGTTTGTPTETTTASRGPAGESRFEGVSVPDHPQDVTWYHEERDSPTYLDPGTERTDLPATVEYAFVNGTDGAVWGGHWDVYKLHEGEWFLVNAPIHSADRRKVAGRERKRWTLKAAHGSLSQEGPPYGGPASKLGHLGEGRYGVVVGFAGDSGALLDVEAPPVDLEPTADLTTERDGERVVATSERWDDPEQSRDRVTVRRAPAADPVETLIPEQVMQPRSRALRNALSAFELGVATVVLRTDDGLRRWRLGPVDDEYVFEYDGETYATPA